MNRIRQSFSREKIGYMFRVLTHPADAFYEIRHREQGSPALALLVIVLFGVCYSVNRIFANFVVNDVDPRQVNGLSELFSIFLLALLFVVGNWSVTCLMEGEGRFKDIVTVVGYALLPITLVMLPATALSHALASGEEVFYTILLGVGLVWSGVLILLGVMTVHNYTLLKTLATLLLTAAAMFIIIFFALLLADMLNQLLIFFRSIYTEIIFRL